MFASTTEIISIVAVVVVGGVGLTAWFVSRCIKIVQQGSVGVVKRFGEFKSVDQPGTPRAATLRRQDGEGRHA